VDPAAVVEATRTMRACSTQRQPHEHRMYRTMPSDVGWEDSTMAVARWRPQAVHVFMTSSVM
jgi:hypothetical protein